MNIGAAIFKILGDDSNLVTDLGGTKKIYPVRAPQRSAFPYIVYNKVSTTANDTKDGVSTVDVVRMQFDFYHTLFDDNYTIEERARTLLDKYMGTIAGGSGTILLQGWTTQKFTNTTGTTITVTTDNLPSANFDLNLEVYRDGILLIESVNFTVSGNVITPTIPFMDENILVKFKP